MLEGRHKHLSDEEVARLMLARSTMEECSATVVPHLDALCPECRGTHRRLAALAQESGNWDVETVLHERALSGPAVQELVDLPQHERLARIRSNADLQTWEACVLLMLSSREAGFDKADLAVELASAALAVTERLGPRAYDAVWVADLRARARAQYGNALRVVGELRSASEQFQLALAELERGTGDPEVHGGVLSLLASLYIAQRRLDDAAATIKQARLALRSARAGSLMGEHEDEIRLALKEGIVFKEKGDLEEAARLFGDVAGWAEREKFPRLYGIAVFNRTFALAYMGREGAEQASQHLPEVLRVYMPTASPTDRLRVLWMQGLIHHELGELGPAEASYREAYEGFLTGGQGLDAALVAMYLARLLLEHGQREDLETLSQQLLQIFAAADLKREVTAILVLLQTALQEDRLTLDLLKQLQEHLKRKIKTPA
jgi:tetratricopeptide (TPR) repeat protein